ncbi:Aste57867_16595 [Aphanomyces stellatus]|uniref:Aste57867_16595 protein n=1 Tax=Aphanomyces stellatus TaxID=120398 RepID=A0A485L7E5_9STRA|nr:hypothetical protein As57867_016538 [Aphanomyces stellatus]VFT93366.1 Aste57867_16595 [Aphanomyces stellatus]
MRLSARRSRLGISYLIHATHLDQRARPRISSLASKTPCARTKSFLASCSHRWYSLSSAEQQAIQAQLSTWKASTVGSEARAKGFWPKGGGGASVASVHTHSMDELDRFHNTLLDVRKAQQLNPAATFSPFNAFALLTPTEFNLVVLNEFVAASPTTVVAPTSASVVLAPTTPSTIDWSTNKCNPPVQSQGQCGSCWAFSTVGTVAFAHCLATGLMLNLSAQQLVSCDTLNGGCAGGSPKTAIDYMRQSGICSADDYPYTSGTTSAAGQCNASCTKTKLAIGPVTAVTSAGESSLLAALQWQPVTVVVEAGNPVWRNYKSGVVTQCPGNASDHAVVAVGAGVDYWKIKNSWGTQWGDGGYIYLQRSVGGKGMCNVAQSMWYPQLLSSTSPPATTPTPPSTAQTTTTPVPTSAKPTTKTTTTPPPITPAPKVVTTTTTPPPTTPAPKVVTTTTPPATNRPTSLQPTPTLSPPPKPATQSTPIPSLTLKATTTPKPMR